MEKHNSLSANVIGAGLVGFLFSPIIYVALIVATYLFLSELHFLDPIFLALAISVVSSVLSSLLDRVLHIKRNRYRVYGFLPTMNSVLPWLFVGFILPFLIMGSLAWGFVGLISGLVGAGVSLVIFRPWKDIVSEEEYAAKSAESKRIIREGFSEIADEVEARKIAKLQRKYRK